MVELFSEIKSDKDPGQKPENRPHIGVGVLVWRNNKLLLGQRISEDEEGCWQFPGGHLEAGESVIQCARRELHEETGLFADSFRHLGFTDLPFVIGQTNYLTLFVSCDCDSGEAQVLESDKCRTWSWFDHGCLPQPLFEPISLFLEQQSRSTSVVDLYALHQSCGRNPGTP